MLSTKRRIFLALLALFGLWVGLQFYTSCREIGHMALFPAWLKLFTWQQPVSLFGNYVWSSAPSFLHVFAFGLLSATVIRRPQIAVVLWLVCNLVWEIATGFHLDDIVAAGVGAVVVIAVLRLTIGPGLNLVQRSRPLLAKAVFICGVLCMVATSQGSQHIVSIHQPVYLSYDEFRNAVSVGPPQELRKAGKIYLYETYLLVNEPNIGLHVFDNTNPEKPKALSFVTIPGSLDMAVKDGRLYVDSYIDLLTFKIVDGQLSLVDRQQNVFGYNPYQAISTEDGVYFDKIDPKRGVVIGYEKKQSPLQKKKAENQ